MALARELQVARKGPEGLPASKKSTRQVKITLYKVRLFVHEMKGNIKRERIFKKLPELRQAERLETSPIRERTRLEIDIRHRQHDQRLSWRPRRI